MRRWRARRARVEAGDRGHALGAQEVHDLAGPPEDPGGRVADDQPGQPGALRLVVIGVAPMVADQRIGHDDDLAGVRGVGADLLVAGLGRVDDEIAAVGHGCPEGDAMEDRAVLERQEARAERADPRIDDRIGGDLERRRRIRRHD